MHSKSVFGIPFGEEDAAAAAVASIDAPDLVVKLFLWFLFSSSPDDDDDESMSGFECIMEFVLAWPANVLTPAGNLFSSSIDPGDEAEEAPPVC